MTTRNLLIIMIIYSIALYYTVIVLYHFIFNLFVLILTVKQKLEIVDIAMINITLILIMFIVFYKTLKNKKSINVI